VLSKSRVSVLNISDRVAWAPCGALAPSEPCVTLSSHTAQATLLVRLVTRDAVCDSSHTLSSVTRWLVSWTDNGFITGHSIRLVLQDSQFGHLRQVCTLSRQGIPAFPPPYPSHYKTAFAFCPLFYPLRNSASLTLCLLSRWTDPMGLTMFRRQPVIQMCRWLGSLGTLRCPRPLGTVLDSFPSYGSSHPAVAVICLRPVPSSQSTCASYTVS